MPSKPEKVVEILSMKDELSMIDLRKELGMENPNSFIKLINSLEGRTITTRYEGRERLVRLYSAKPQIDYFIKNYPNRLKSLKKELEKESKKLLNNLPIVSKKQPMKKIPMKVGVLELDKKRNVWRDMGKTEDSHGYTFRARPTAEKQLLKILDLLSKLYQESSTLNFAKPIIDNPKLIETYQKRSEKIITEITDNINKILLKKDPTSFVYVNNRFRNVLYGLIFKNTLKKEMES